MYEAGRTFWLLHPPEKAFPEEKYPIISKSKTDSLNAT